MEFYHKMRERRVEKFTAEQLERIIDTVVPLIAAPEDHEFFRGVLHLRAADSKSSADYATFITKLLKEAV